jgi:hypothetical protein
VDKFNIMPASLAAPEEVRGERTSGGERGEAVQLPALQAPAAHKP